VNRVYRVLLPACMLVCFSPDIAWTQSYPAPPPPVAKGPFGRNPISRGEDEEQQSNQPQLAKTRTAAQLERERYLELKKETADLERLATELKLAVTESNEHTLSLELAKKADQVEKLAKRIRDRTKHGY
jgi:hypothetical protein